jgi:putative DNA primase/helicase
VRRVLYRLPELLAADPAAVVFVPEGEKDVDAMRALGFVATCNVGGAGKWRTEYSESLAGRHTVILADNDEPGRKHAQHVAKSLAGKAKSIKILELPGLPDKGDVSDWLAAGGTRDKLFDLAAAASEWQASSDANIGRPLLRDANTERRRSAAHKGNGSAPTALEAPDLTDIGNAKRFAEQNGADVRYCHPWGKWLVWDGKRWKIDDTGAITARAKETALHLFQRPEIRSDKSRTALIRFAAQSCHSNAIRGALFLSQSEPGIPILPDQLDGDSFKFNCPNGTIDLRTGELLKHRREDLITKLCPTAFDHGARSLEFDRFLESVFSGSAPLMTFIQRLAGYGLTGDVREQILPIFWGVGANGKSTLLNALLVTLGADYAIKAKKDFLAVKKQEGHSTEIMDLFGTRLVVCSETDDDQRLAESLVKDLTGGDRIRGRRMREDNWEYSPTHKILLATNHKPQIRGTDHAIWRRLRLIPFNQIFEGASQDRQLAEKLRAEAPGILAWAVRGCLDWQRYGLGAPDEVTAATAAYRSEQDVIGAFFTDVCIVAAHCKVKVGDLYTAYSKWAENTGERDVGSRRFGQAMTERGFERVKGRERWYYGIGLRE